MERLRNNQSCSVFLTSKLSQSCSLTPEYAVKCHLAGSVTVADNAHFAGRNRDFAFEKFAGEQVGTG